MSPNAAVRTLMSGAIDYAGLFPPAGLAMSDAVARYASYRGGRHAWMLGRFIVPAARLEECITAFSALLSAAEGKTADASPWRLAVIAKPADAGTLAAFNARYASRLVIDTVETPVVRADDPEALAGLGVLAQTYTVFAEVGWATDPAATISALAAVRVRAKIRTGGVTAAEIPDAAAVARFILACRHARVPFKATAGLHHAWRAEYPLTYAPDCPRATMYGFLNLLLASAAAVSGADAAEVEQTLTAGLGTAFEDRGCVLPSGRALPTELLAAARTAAVTSFGSCSFEEPVAELTERGLLWST